MNKFDIATELFNLGAIQFGSFKLKLHENNPSIPLSPIYFNLRTSDNPKPGPLTKDVVSGIAELLKNMIQEKGLKFEFLAGIPVAGNPIAKALMVQYHSHVESIELEKQSDGARRWISHIKSPLAKRVGKVLLVDDLITHADSKLEAISVLEMGGFEVKDLVVILDREQGGAQALKQRGVLTHSLFTLSEILEIYVDGGKIDRLKKDSIIEYIKKIKM